MHMAHNFEGILSLVRIETNVTLEIHFESILPAILDWEENSDVNSSDDEGYLYFINFLSGGMEEVLNLN